ncbi:hypothetical protein V1951_12880 [Yersinia sp. 2544 StPb PI]
MTQGNRIAQELAFSTSDNVPLFYRYSTVVGLACSVQDADEFVRFAAVN